MASRNRVPRNYCLYVTGFAEDIERRIIKGEFSKFGHLEKLFLDQAGLFAKVFYSDKETGDAAIRELHKTHPSWKVQHFEDNYEPFKFKDKSKMASYGNFYEDEEDFSENFDYCNIHGHPLTVLQADSGDLYVNLKDIKKSGFTVFRRDNFNSVLVDKRQIGKEFELHLLSEAKNYIIKNRVAVIDEEVILQTIQRCKSKLLGEATEKKNNFGDGRSVVPSAMNNFTITSENQSPPSNTRLPMLDQAPTQRPPKSLPSNFMPTNVQRNEGFRGRGPTQQGTRTPQQNNSNRGERDYKSENSFKKPEDRNNAFVNGFGLSKNDHRDQNLNTSNNSDSRNSYRKQGNGNEQRRTPRFQEEIGKVTFEVGQTYHVQVVFNEKENVYWVHDKSESGNVLEDMFIKINEMEGDLEPLTPTVGQLVIALFEEAWNRGRVINLDPLTVHFIDFGNKCEVEQVKSLPDVFKKTPALAVRIVNNRASLSEMAEVQIKINREYDDGTYAVDIVDSDKKSYAAKKPESPQERFNMEIKAAKPSEVQKPEPPQERFNIETKAAKPSEVKKPEPLEEKFYFQVPKPIAALKHGDKVMIIDTEDNRFLVRTRECALKSKELTEYIKNLDKSALTLTNVKEGQLVLCSKDGLVGLYRAVVSKKESGSVVTVKYIDFPGEDDLSVKSLRNVDEFLANEPCSIISSPVHKSLSNMGEKVAEYISKICQNKEKVVVVLSANDFELQFDDGVLLSEKIQELSAPKPAQPTVKPTEEKPSTPKESDKNDVTSRKQSCTPTNVKVLYDDMDWLKLKPGTTDTLMCYSLKDVNDITMLSTTEEVIMYLEQITDLEVADNTPYKPDEFEMCLVSFKGPEEENASWYRAAVLGIEDDGYFVTFVDFGNKETVKYQEIRKFPVHLKKIPILGVNCKCVGIPETPEILEHMKMLIPEGDQVEVIVKRLVGLAYEIEIPSVYKELKSKGLY